MSEAVSNGATGRRPVEFQVKDGIRLRGDAWGDAAARPVLLLHGGGQTRHSWSSCGARLGESGWYAIALDLRGHGESDWAPEGRYAPKHFVGDLEAVCAELAQPPVVVGASLGGITGLLAEGRRPGLAAALVLVDITPKVEPKGIERIMRFMLDKPEGFESLEEAAESVARYRQHRAKPSDLSGLRKNLRHGEDGRWRWHWDPAFVNRAHGQQMLAEGVDAAEVQDFMNGKALMEAARSLSVPVLLVRGKASDVVSADGADEFLDAVPHARYADVAGAGHMVAGDRNDAFNDAVLGFLRDAFA